MGRTSRVAPESSDESKSGVTSNGKSSSNSQLAFENLDLSSAITGKVIETNLSTTNLRLTENDKPVKPKRKPRKRLARSVSEVVEEKEKRERNVISRFAYKYRRNGVFGICVAVVDEIHIFKYRCGKCSRFCYNKVTCQKQKDEDN
ncbi:unnamed protein product [Oppiella nova]|uniref:Uncharacterized protein n=1 Tax=Oppiella nova TaxID=334625 RepID=A0A7R9MGE7_9ACAR|nr:unnamed protein product [Oppiella nova]CAG2176766.1 unnamed protein product [Oppiella nova]